MKNPNHKNRKIIRLQTWDYSWAGSYFITICTDNRKHYFGEVENGEMKLSNLGVIANILWFEIKNRGKNIELGEFVIMPNHIHGILKLNNNDISVGAGCDLSTSTDTGDSLIPSTDTLDAGRDLFIDTGHALYLPSISRFQNIGKNSVSSIIGGYKSAVTKHANRLGFEFKWQTRFHDHIIRDEKSYNNISEYIFNNPKKWDEDKFYDKL